jgi:uncharacterized protein YlzI (FlbEa/FlbD family)
VYFINPAAIELIEIEPETTTVVTAHGRVSVPTEDNLDALQRLSAEPVALPTERALYPF